MDWAELSQTSGDVTIIIDQSSRHPSVELLHRGELVAQATLRLRTPSVVSLIWTDAPGPSVPDVALAMRELIRTLYQLAPIQRVETLVPSTNRRTIMIAQRTGLRREGILRGGIEYDGELVDGELFASRATDPPLDEVGGFTYMLDSIMPTKRLISHVVMTDPSGRILLCQTTFKKDWELPGGIVEPGESPVLAATREVAEEIGIDVQLGRLLVMDWLPPWLGWSDAIEVLYDGGEYDADLLERLTLDTREIRDAQWFTAEEAASMVSPLNARRLPLIIPNKPATTLHLENGELTHEI